MRAVSADLVRNAATAGMDAIKLWADFFGQSPDYERIALANSLVFKLSA
jgi:hypothetical protein